MPAGMRTDDHARLRFAASSALRFWPGCRAARPPTLLDEAAHRRTEAVLGIPFDEIVYVCADFGERQGRARAGGVRRGAALAVIAGRSTLVTSRSGHLGAP